jgi:hypothetical protein
MQCLVDDNKNFVTMAGIYLLRQKIFMQNSVKPQIYAYPLQRYNTVWLWQKLHESQDLLSLAFNCCEKLPTINYLAV